MVYKLKKNYYNLKILYNKKNELNNIKRGFSISLKIYLIKVFLFL